MLWVLIWIASTNIIYLCIYKVDKKYNDCVLIGVCAVIRSNKVHVYLKPTYNESIYGGFRVLGKDLTLKAPITTAADNTFKSIFLLFLENKSWHFMGIVCQTDDSHEISKLTFWEKYFFRLPSATNFAWCFKG